MFFSEQPGETITQKRENLLLRVGLNIQSSLPKVSQDFETAVLNRWHRACEIQKYFARTTSPRWDLHVDMIGPYSKSIRKQQPGAAIIRNNDSIACMTAIGRFKIVKVPTYNLNEVTGSDDEYIDNHWPVLESYLTKNG